MPLRAQQQAICAYQGGRMAVSAVPGSGKTYTLAALAARLMGAPRISALDQRELLIVTFTTSAVDNIRMRIRQQLHELGLPDGGYRVLTLHGLAHLIVRMRPDLAGTGSDFALDDEINGGQAMTEATRWFIDRAWGPYWRSFLPDPDVDRKAYDRARERWRGATYRIGSDVTRLAKNLLVTPRELLTRLCGPVDAGVDVLALPAPPDASPFLWIGAQIYAHYEAHLSASGRLDFDDLIARAILALDSDETFRSLLGRRWHVVLEDEAQDSTPLQERILSQLARDHGNWVRVGDPNQAIMTTFTASDVRFFREFARRPDVTPMPLTRSGRSAQPIIDLANWLSGWCARHHPEPEVRASALTDDHLVLPLEEGETPANPAADEGRIHVQDYDDEAAEQAKVALSAAEFVLKQPTRTCAILTATNAAGGKVIEMLAAQQVRLADRLGPNRPLFQDQLRNAKAVRDVAQALACAVQFCSNPLASGVLARLRGALLALDVGHRLDDPRMESRLNAVLRSVLPIEQLLFPVPGGGSVVPARAGLDEPAEAELAGLGELVARWVRASLLPIDQLILTIAQGVLTRDNELAIAHSLAVSMRRFAAANPAAQLSDLADKLGEIASNRLSFLSRSLLETGFEPQPGVITVTTMHKAKGLEWDRVYLLDVDQSEFPHDPEAQGWRSQEWFLAGRDPATEARKALESLMRRDGGESGTRDGAERLVREARIEYIAERMRLLYVGVTRARRELQISYAQHRHRQRNELALPIREWQRGG